jgi:hypothetical protein
MGFQIKIVYHAKTDFYKKLKHVRHNVLLVITKVQQIILA